MPFFQPKLTLPSSLTFRGKTILITGASAGLGLSAMKHLLLHGAQEIIAGVRSVAKGEAVRSQVLSDAALKKVNPDARITILHLNAEDHQSVLAFAGEVKKKYEDKLDMVLLNAGTGSFEWKICATGHEKTVQVNVLSPALLAFELLPSLARTAIRTGQPSRLCWVSSFVQFDHSLQKNPIGTEESLLSYFDDESKFVAMARYPNSKLLGTMFVEELSKHVDPKKVIVNDVSPGLVKTGFGEYPAWLRIMFAGFFALKGRDVDEGAKTYLHALGVAGKESHGQYLSDNLVAG
jgi:NAD(P)-dependent dehydrogenase (short-subunit alcohol dehydrogenase family)